MKTETDAFHPVVTIAGRKVGAGAPPFIVAEMSGNHNGSIGRALAIVDAAADAGAHALKIQTYTADTMTIDCDAPAFTIRDEKSPWFGRRLHELYREAATPWEWHEPIFRRCRERGMAAFSTPFDETALAFLEKLGAPCYKIASFENTDLPLVRAAARTGKPLIISTGLMTEGELRETVAAARSAGCRELVLLKCTSVYPADPAESRLRAIPWMRETFACPVGLSDHTPGIGVATAATALGAVLIEKHFTLARADGGVDSSFSLEPAELRALVAATGEAWAALGSGEFGRTKAEEASLQFRRSLYVVKDVRAGEVFTAVNLRRIRPGFGMAPKHYESALGRRAARDIAAGTPFAAELVEGGLP